MMLSHAYLTANKSQLNNRFTLGKTHRICRPLKRWNVVQSQLPGRLPSRPSPVRLNKALQVPKLTPANQLYSTVSDDAVVEEEIETASSSSIVEGAERLIIPLGESELVLETGKVGRQASGAVMLKEGETVVYTTACFDKDVTGDGSFAPLMVVYSERMSAAGRTASGFLKRDGRNKDADVLVSRLIDRPIRPMMQSGWSHDTQVLAWVMSYDGMRSADALSITAAGAALALSEIPLVKPVAGVRVGWPRDSAEPVVNPTLEQMSDSKLDLVMAGTEDAVLMIEGFGDFLSEEEMVKSVALGQEAISGVCKDLTAWASQVGKEKKQDTLQLPPEGIDQKIGALVGPELDEALRIQTKKAREVAVSNIKQQAMDTLTTAYDDASVDLDSDDAPGVDKDGEVEDGYNPTEVSLAFKRAASKKMRTMLLDEGIRSDGRAANEVRDISCSAGLLPRVHGSSLFTRGETQAIGSCTLGSAKDAQRIETLETGDSERSFYLQYFFPPSSVGETGRTGGAGRREIGHGMLAERALAPALPSKEDFPYTVRVESHITESNGSSSMASVCAGCLAMLDAGVPLKRMVSGVAMGLVLDDSTGELRSTVLTDILGSEDALGDMDFKVAGDEHGITAFQMDIKVEGITLDIIKSALSAAGDGRRTILEEMRKCAPPPRRAMAPETPRIIKIQVNPKMNGELIGPGGKHIRKMIEDFEVTNIDINNEGQITIFGPEKGAEECKNYILMRTEEPEVGKTYFNCEVKNVLEFGAFVEILPGKDGLVHVSELDLTRVDDPNTVCKVGDRMDVKLLEINKRGQLKCSRKALMKPKRPERPADRPPVVIKRKDAAADEE